MTDPLPTSGRLAGIDFGTRRIGIALTDAGRTLASPYENFTRAGQRHDAERFRRLVREEDVVAFVVGLPLHTSGDESDQSRQARRFGQWLQAETGLPVAFHDERYTTAAAEEHLLGADLTRKKRRARRDMLAAQIMLAAFLEQPGLHR
jgi:putative Holliday junction resolvase